MINTKMEEKQILEGNKLIAEFMGYRVFHKRYPRNHGIGAPETEWKDMIVDKAKYHSSYDWLMPVIEKIYLMEGVSVLMTMGSLEILKYGGSTFRGSNFCIAEETGLICWFISVVEFVKYLNSKNP